MPVAYGAAPVGAGAAVAGVVSSAGILGMLRFLPGGHEVVAPWGLALMALGITAALYAALTGVLQKNPRALLGYSSMSQFGLMTVGVGSGLATAEIWPAATAAVIVYVVHHGLAKAALFAVSDTRNALSTQVPRLLVALSAVPALALTGFPLTSGAVAKVGLKGVVHDAPEAWAHAFDILLPVAAVGTTLLVARFLVLTFTEVSGLNSVATSSTTATSATSAPSTASPTVLRNRAGALGILLAATAITLWIAPSESVAYAAKKSLTSEYLWVLTWPVIVGVAIATGAWFVRKSQLSLLLGRVAPGDVWAGALAALDRRWVVYQEWLAQPELTAEASADADRRDTKPSLALRIERVVLSWDFSAAAVLALLVLVMALTLLA